MDHPSSDLSDVAPLTLNNNTVQETPPSSSSTIPLLCPGILLDFSTTCTNWPHSQCEDTCCTTCCISHGGCQHPEHRVYSNPAGYFEPNWTHFERTSSRPYLLPIVSPRDGDFEETAGTASYGLLADGWQERRLQLRAEAINRYEAGEGTTIFVFLWPEVRLYLHLKICLPNKSVPQDMLEPALFMRVIRRGRSWSLAGDSVLQGQLKRDGISHNLHQHYLVYRAESKDWVRRHSTAAIQVTGIGASIFIKSLDITHLPLFPLLLQRTVSAVNLY